MVSPTGARLGKMDHPAVPLTIPEIVAATAASVAAGANALHLHIRDSLGLHSLDPGLYAEALSEVECMLPGLPVQITTEAGGKYNPADQFRVIERLQPRWASVSVREIARDPRIAKRLYDLCSETGTEIQHILYDETDAHILREWQKASVLGDTESVLLVLGQYGRADSADPLVLDGFLDALPPVGRWMVCAFGPPEHACLARAADLGGDVRVGFENSLTDAHGNPWYSVAASVSELIQMIGKDRCHIFSHAV